MKRNGKTYGNCINKVMSIVVMLSLMFFIAQGNSMFITDLFADKFVELIDSDLPSPSEERHDCGKKTNNINEEDHLYLHASTIKMLLNDEIPHFKSTNLFPYSSVLMSVRTPPPEIS